MKLIIDISELDYECAKQRWMSGNDPHKMDYYISKGIPFEDVKAENKGEWIDWKGRNGRYNGIPICSNCNTGFPIFAKDYNFCPNCGADMRGE